MLWILLFALLPLTVQAQITFGPIRLDDSLSVNFSYPDVEPVGEIQLRCTWASYTENRLSAFGQMTAWDGTPIGPRIVYEDQPPGQFTCAPALSVVSLAGGGEARLLNHT
ncbi:MAG: hypothetical protein ACOZB3_06745 [Calditrichota bacterium]